MTRPRFSRIVPELQRQYRERARAGDWETCCALAVQLAGCDPHVAAAADYAHGYALERLGEPDSWVLELSGTTTVDACRC